MKTLAVVRAMVFALLLAYVLYAMPWSYAFLPKEGASLALPVVISDLKALAVAAWLGVAWIGVDAWLSFSVLRKQAQARSGKPEAAK